MMIVIMMIVRMMLQKMFRKVQRKVSQPSVRTTHAAADYQEFTTPHSAYNISHSPTLPNLAQNCPTF